VTVAVLVHKVDGFGQLHRVFDRLLVGQSTPQVLQIGAHIATGHVFQTDAVQLLVLDRVDERDEVRVLHRADLLHELDFHSRVFRHAIGKLLLGVLDAQLDHFLLALGAANRAQ